MQKVSSGEKFQVKADTWNSFIDAANYHKDHQLKLGSEALRGNAKTGIVLVSNDSGGLLEQFSPVILDDLIIQPDDTEKEQEFKSRVPVFSGKKSPPIIRISRSRFCRFRWNRQSSARRCFRGSLR